MTEVKSVSTVSKEKNRNPMLLYWSLSEGTQNFVIESLGIHLYESNKTGFLVANENETSKK